MSIDPWPARRRFVAGLGSFMAGVAVTRPSHAVRAMAQVAVIYPGAPVSGPDDPLERFKTGLRELGLVEGRNLVLDFHFESLQPDALPTALARWVQWPAHVIVAGTTGSASAARRATASLPIVMAVSADPVADGLVESLARPGGNVTGLSIMSPMLSGRRLQLLADAVPGLRRVALLLDSAVGRRLQAERQEYEAAAQQLDLQVMPFVVGDPGDLPAVFTAIRRSGAQGLVLMQSPMLNAQRRRLAALSLESRLPSIAGTGAGQFAREGGLMNFGASIGASWHRAATYVQRILNGARPADLPVEQPRRFELVVNQATAQALGLRLPSHLLVLADEVL